MRLKIRRTSHRPANDNTDPHRVWKVCAYLRVDEDAPCEGCAERHMTSDGPASPACFRIAQQLINVVETGDPWRRPNRSTE